MVRLALLLLACALPGVASAFSVIREDSCTPGACFAPAQAVPTYINLSAVDVNGVWYFLGGSWDDGPAGEPLPGGQQHTFDCPAQVASSAVERCAYQLWGNADDLPDPPVVSDIDWNNPAHVGQALLAALGVLVVFHGWSKGANS